LSRSLPLYDFVRHSAKLYPSRPALIDGERVVTYATLWERSRRAAELLLAGLGLQPGSRFGLLTRNRPEIGELYMAAAISGCACVPLNYRLTGADIAALLADATAPALMADPTLEEQIEGVLAAGYDGRIVRLGEEYESVLSRCSSDASSLAGGSGRDVAEIVLQMYTSGTTGVSKGVMLSHRNLVANSWTNLAEHNVVEGDTYLVTTPLCQIGGVSRMLTSFQASSTLRMLTKFDPEHVLQLVDSEAVTTAFLVPTMIQMLLDAAPRNRLIGPRFRRLCYGGSPIPRSLLEEAMARMPCEFQQGYGLTESSPNLTTLRPEDHVLDGPESVVRRLGSVGRESVGVNVRVVDEEGHDVRPGEQGEIVASGANIMEGYWHRPEATAAAIRDGWLHTGDLGTVDDEQYLFITDRKSDMLISGGINVYPREIELLIERQPAVAEVAVVGRPDRRWGEVPVAFIVLRPGVDQARARAELEVVCRQRLAGYKTPKDYVFVSALPRNAMGKVMKRHLRNGDPS
jgi:fatty-acyl-CoA synthase